MLKFGIKSAIFGSVVYYTVDKGFWKDSDTTSALYEEMEKGVTPYVGELTKQIPYELPSLPSSNTFSYLMKYYWNCGVKTSFKFLVNLPDHASDAVTNGYVWVSTALNESTVQSLFDERGFKRLKEAQI